MGTRNEIDAYAFSQEIKSMLDQKVMEAIAEKKAEMGQADELGSVDEETLQELSKKTLGSYLTKANVSVSRLDRQAEGMRGIAQSARGLSHKSWEVSSKKFNTSDQAKPMDDTARVFDRKASDVEDKSLSRRMSMRKATKRLVGEGFMGGDKGVYEHTPSDKKYHMIHVSGDAVHPERNHSYENPTKSNAHLKVLIDKHNVHDHPYHIENVGYDDATATFHHSVPDEHIHAIGDALHKELRHKTTIGHAEHYGVVSHTKSSHPEHPDGIDNDHVKTWN